MTFHHKSHAARLALPAALAFILLLACIPGAGWCQQVGPLVIASFVVDDDTSGQSGGNGDGRADAGELIELIITLRNEGALAARSVHGTLSETDDYVELVDAEEDFPDIEPGGTAMTELDFDFRVLRSIPPNHVVQFRLDISADGGGPWSVFFDIVMQQLGPIQLSDIFIDDDNLGESSGNGDGMANAGERIALILMVRNLGANTLLAVAGTLSTLDPYAALSTNAAILDSLPGGATGVFEFDLLVAAETPAGHSMKFNLDVNAGATANWHEGFNIDIADSSNSTDVAGMDEGRGAPADFSLEQNYPNPFNAATLLPVAIPAASQVELVIYNVLGEKVRVLGDGRLPAGRHHFLWNGRDGLGLAVPSGIYWVVLRADRQTILVRKIVALK